MSQVETLPLEKAHCIFFPKHEKPRKVRKKITLFVLARLRSSGKLDRCCVKLHHGTFLVFFVISNNIVLFTTRKSIALYGDLLKNSQLLLSLFSLLQHYLYHSDVVFWTALHFSLNVYAWLFSCNSPIFHFCI